MIKIELSKDEVEFFRKKASEKVDTERWVGRNTDRKKSNFFSSFVTEEAFKKILSNKGLWFRHRGLYVGDAKGAGKDFIVKMNDRELSIGIRCVNNLQKFKNVPYPDDRFRTEPENIADFIVACTNEDGIVDFYGLIEKDKLLDELKVSQVLYSKANQEKFRVVSIDKFDSRELSKLLDTLDKV